MILIERLTPKKRLLGFNDVGELVARECVLCAEFLPVTQFAKHAGTNLGINTRCKTCEARKEKRDKVNRLKRESRKINYDVQLEKKRAYNDKTRARRQELAIEYREKNRSKLLEHARKWKQKNPHVVNEYNAKRSRATEQSRLEEEKPAVQALYKEATTLTEATGVEYCVDHIIPLNHPDICGLHRVCNLKVLTKLENNRKHNKFDGTYENQGWRARYE